MRRGSLVVAAPRDRAELDRFARRMAHFEWLDAEQVAALGPGLAARLAALGPRVVLLKGGHLGGEESPDYLATADGGHWLEGARISTQHTHGTGCTLSSAIAARLALGHGLLRAVRGAKAYLTEAIAAAEALDVGGGNGPVHHGHAGAPGGQGG